MDGQPSLLYKRRFGPHNDWIALTLIGDQRQKPRSTYGPLLGPATIQ